MRSVVFALVAASFAMSGVASASPVGEKELRCAVPADAPLFMRSVGAVGAVTLGRTTVQRGGQQLPGVMVDGWHPTPAPLGRMLVDLGTAAGFKVAGAEPFGPVTWSGATAPLSSVVDSLTSQAGAHWSFSGGVLSVERGPAPTLVEASMPLPQSRDAALALLDTLRGLEARSVSVREGTVSFSAPPESLAKIRSTLSGIGEIYAFDVAFLQVRPVGGSLPWKTLGGVSAGASYVVFGDDAQDRLSALFRSTQGTVRSDGMQTVSGPAGWALVVPENQCGAGGAEVVLKPRRSSNGFALDVRGAGFGSSVPVVDVGQTLVVAAASLDDGWMHLLTIRPRIVSVR